MPATTYLDRFPAIKEPAGPRSKAALAVYQAGASSVLRAVNSLKMIVARQTGADEAVDSSGPDCVAFEEQSVGEDAGTAATTGDDDVCFTNDTDSDDSCNDAEASDGNPLPRPDDDFSRNGVIGSEEGNEPNPEDKAADDEGPPTRKFRWSVTIEEEQKVRERVWKKMEQELEESSRDDSWDSSKEHMQDMVTRRKEIQEMKRLEEIRRERLRKMRSANLRMVVTMAAAGLRISEQASWAKNIVDCAKVIQRAYRARLGIKRDAVMRETIDPHAERPILTPAEWQGGWQGGSQCDADNEDPKSDPLERSPPAQAKISQAPLDLPRPRGTTVLIVTPDNVIRKPAAAVRMQEPAAPMRKREPVAAVEAPESTISVEHKPEAVAIRPLPAPVKQQPDNSRPTIAPAPTAAAAPSPEPTQQKPRPKSPKPAVRAPKAPPARPPAPTPPRPAAALPKTLAKAPKPEMQQASIQTHVMDLLPSAKVSSSRTQDDKFTVKREKQRTPSNPAPRNEQKDTTARRRSKAAASPFSFFQGASQPNTSMPWEGAPRHHGKSTGTSTAEAPSHCSSSRFSGRRSSLDSNRPKLMQLQRGQSTPDGDILNERSLEAVLEPVRPKSAGKGTGVSFHPCSGREAEAPQRRCKSEYSAAGNGWKLPEISLVSPTVSSSSFHAPSASSPSSSSSWGADSTRDSLSSWGDARSMTSSHKSNTAMISSSSEPDEPEMLVPRRRSYTDGHPFGELDQNIGPSWLSKSSDFGTGKCTKPPSGGLNRPGRARPTIPDTSGFVQSAQTSPHSDAVFSAWSGPASPIWDPTVDRCLPNTVFKTPSKSFNPSLAVLQACQGQEPHQKPPTGASRCSTAGSQGGPKHGRGPNRSAAASPNDAPFGITSRGASGGPASPFAPGGTGALVPSSRRIRKRRVSIELY